MIHSFTYMLFNIVFFLMFFKFLLQVRQAVKRMRERRVLSKQEFFNASETQNQSVRDQVFL